MHEGRKDVRGIRPVAIEVAADLLFELLRHLGSTLGCHEVSSFDALEEVEGGDSSGGMDARTLKDVHDEVDEGR